MWIQTYSGKRFDFNSIAESSICLEDIARSLASLCRFNGHTTRFYSVSEHCVVMSGLVAPRAAQAALMHDAAEAYIGDIATPIKHTASKLCDLENEILEVISAKYGIDFGSVRGEVKNADLRMLETERVQLMRSKEIEHWESTINVNPFNIGLPCWSPYEAYSQFLERAKFLGIED